MIHFAWFLKIHETREWRSITIWAELRLEQEGTFAKCVCEIFARTTAVILCEFSSSIFKNCSLEKSNAACMHIELGLGIIHKPRGQLRVVSKMTIL